MEHIHIRRANMWTMLSVVLLLPPAYFLLFGIFKLMGMDRPIGLILLSSLPEVIGVILVYIFPAGAFITSLVAYKKRRRALNLALLVISLLFVFLLFIALTIK